MERNSKAEREIDSNFKINASNKENTNITDLDRVIQEKTQLDFFRFRTNRRMQRWTSNTETQKVEKNSENSNNLAKMEEKKKKRKQEDVPTEVEYENYLKNFTLEDEVYSKMGIIERNNLRNILFQFLNNEKISFPEEDEELPKLEEHYELRQEGKKVEIIEISSDEEPEKLDENDFLTLSQDSEEKESNTEKTFLFGREI